MSSKLKKCLKGLNILLVAMISLTMPLQAISSPVIAAATSSTSAESIDTWMPDKSLQQLVLHALNSTSESVNDHGSSGITSVDQITQTMLLDLKYLMPSTDDAALVAKVTNLTGLEYATNLINVDLTGATIETAPGDWSVLSKVGSNLGTIDATSSTIDLKDLAKLPLASVQYTLKNGDDIGMPNLVSNGSATGIQVTQLTNKQNMTYDADLSTMKAYIPLSDWYKGFVTTSGDPEYEYPNMVTYPTLPTGVTLDMTNHRFVVDLNTWGSKELKIPSFDIKDWTGTAAYDDNSPHYYSSGNTLDATVPMPAAPTDVSQTATVADLTNPTGTIDTTNFGFGSATSADLTIKSGDLTADDITFSPDLAENKINFTLTASGVKKLTAGDLKSVITISAGDKVVNLTLTIEEDPATWMPDAALRNEITTDLKAQLGTDTDLTKTNLAKLDQATNLTGVSNLTGLEYATNLDTLKMTDCTLADLKASNGQVLPKMTNLENIEIDNSDLGGSLADWGLKDVTHLSSLTAKNDQLTNPAVTEYADDANLSVLKLSGNVLTGELSQFPVANWQKLKDLELNDNQLTGAIPADWSGLTNLSILNLSANQLTGTLDSIAQLANLTEVYLDKDGLSGELPSAWFTSTLTHFEANTNQFSGVLPATLSAATSLKWLDVATNQLTGKLPDLSKDTDLSTFAYGSNHITSGRAAAGSSGNYQTWSIDNPDWQTSSDGKKMTLDLSQYYGGEQGQTDYRYLGLNLPSGQSGVTLDKTDPAHPLLTIDTTSTTVTNGDFTFNLVDQAGEQAVLNDSMNYLATVTVPITLAIPKTYAIETTDVDFGSHPIGSGIINATDSSTQKAFSLAVHSTNAVGDSYQLTAQTTGLVSDGQTLPLYYYTGQHNILLSNVAQAIYDYQPTSDDDTTVVGNSSDATKGNLRTEIDGTVHTGTYTGQVTYTLASAPADATLAGDSDMSQVTANTISQLSPTISADSLSVTQAATRTKLETNMTNFVQNQLADSDGVLYTSYKAGQTGGTQQEITETNGLWLLALAMSNNETTFDTAFNGIVSRFYDSATQTFNWQSLGADHTITAGSASIDDLRIIQALMIMNQKQPNNDRTAWLNRLIDGFTKYDLNAYYQMIDGYSSSGGQEKQIRLDYLDLSTLKAVYEAKGLGATGDTAYNQQLKLIKDSYISDKLPLFATYYNYSTGDYQVNGDTAAGQINVTDGLLTMLNLAKVGELPTTSLNWLKAHTADRSIYNDYNIADGTPVSKSDAASNYAYVAQIAAATGDTDLYNQALTVLKSMTSDDDSTDSPLTPSDPLYGSTQYDGESYAFNDLNMLLAYTSVFGTN